MNNQPLPETKTPRTDAAEQNTLFPHSVSAKFARQLETELVAMTVQRNSACSCHEHDHKGISAYAIALFGRDDIGYTDGVREIEKMKAELAAMKAERDEERRKLDTILYDVNYKGGLQDWQARANNAVLEALKAAELAASTGAKLTATQDVLTATQDVLRKAVEAMKGLCDAVNLGECAKDAEGNECRAMVETRATIEAAEGLLPET